MTDHISEDALSNVRTTAIELYEAGDRDLLGGGVVPSNVATEVPYTVSHVQTALRALCQRNEFERVRGLAPEEHRPRVSYAPTDLADSDTGLQQAVYE